MSDGFGELTRQLRALVAEFDAAMADGGYAAGDAPQVDFDLLSAAADAIDEQTRRVEAVEAENERLRALMPYDAAVWRDGHVVWRSVVSQEQENP